MSKKSLIIDIVLFAILVVIFIYARVTKSGEEQENIDAPTGCVTAESTAAQQLPCLTWEEI